jgi:hypothetical protein
MHKVLVRASKTGVVIFKQPFFTTIMTKYKRELLKNGRTKIIYAKTELLYLDV